MFKFVVLLSMLTSVAYAGEGGTSVGDGGHGVLCDGPSSQVLQLLDLFEMRTTYDLNPDLPSVSATNDLSAEFMSRAEVALGSGHPLVKTLSSFAVVRALMRGEYFDGRVFTIDLGLIDTPLPNNCHIVQLGRRFHGRDLSFEFDMTLKPLLTDTEEVGLILHETLHTWFTVNGFGFDDTGALRQAVLYLMAPESFRQENVIQFRKIVETRKRILPSEFHQTLH